MDNMIEIETLNYDLPFKLLVQNIHEIMKQKIELL